ncbi:MAG: DNA replication/repair protein RecF [Clostridia bacterium]|nr:DNA replication/repair protein RecF [Clostridia bacterium]
MEITKLQLYSYRNYLVSEVIFNGGINVICGRNAQGKTNLLEAVYFCVVGKSFRAKKEKEVINLDKEIAKIKVFIKKDVGESTVEIIFSRKEKKTVRINGIPIKKISELLGEFNAVFFSPDELKLIKESPEDRRRFMDIDISQTNKQYFYLLSRYNEVLQNRNKQLKSQLDKKDLTDIMKIWNEQLADCALKISKFRENFVLMLAPYAKKAHLYLTEGAENLEVEYVGIKEQTKEDIVNKLESNLEKDLQLGYTSFGPHRDDIKVSIDGVDLRTFGSQGQQRTAALSLKLAELDIIEKQLYTKPVLLLDDVLSELDNNRKMRLLEYCKNTQTLITCTSFDFDVPHKKIQIQKGEIKA